MTRNYDITIAISSFNRDDKVGGTLSRLFESDLSQFEAVEVIVVDDGSPRPVADVLARIDKPPAKIDLRVIRQENSGIGATRNRGFREANADLILFLDDDILIRPSTLNEFVEAQGEQGGGVVFGSYPFISHETESLARFASGLYGYAKISEKPQFEEVNAITSGLLCVNRSMLGGLENFYDDGMTIPAAEEYEVIYRFHETGVPIVHALHISAIHNHHLELSWLGQQQYKYGLATAEAFSKHPEIEKIEHFAELKQKLDALFDRDMKARMKRTMASPAGRKCLLWISKLVSRLLPKTDHRVVFGILATSNYWGGYREGIDRFGSEYAKN